MRDRVNKEDYEVMRGGSWPSWEEFLSGKDSESAEINEEIKQFINTYAPLGKVFPIVTETSCLSKWNSSSLYLPLGQTSSCCLADNLDLTLDNFDNFHNLPRKIEDRELMLQGKWPTSGCEHCIHVEAEDGFSERLDSNQTRGLTPVELELDPTATSVTPTNLDIFVNNTCNFSCLYCSETLSSQIQNENKKFGTFNQNGVVINSGDIPINDSVQDQMFIKLIRWLDNNISKLKRLYLLGGEPFLQHDLLSEIFSILDKNPCPQLELAMFSNMNVPEKYWRKYTSKVKELALTGKIKRFDLIGSIDCWGHEASYVRRGLDLDILDRRLMWASQQEDWLHLHISATMVPMSIKTLPDLIAKIATYSKNKEISARFMFVSNEPRPYLHPEIFKYSTWGDSFNRCYQEMDKIDNIDPTAKERLQGLDRYLQSIVKNDQDQIKKLHTYLDELDRRRGTNWRELFPYLDVHE